MYTMYLFKRSLPVLALGVIAGSAHAGLGDILISDGGDVSVVVSKYTGNPGFDNLLGVAAPVNTFVGHNNDWQGTPTPVDLGVIAAGTEVELYLTNPFNETFYTGPAGRNPDGMIHANVNALTAGVYTVDFEDATDFDYGDGRLIISGVHALPTPEPTTMAFLGIGVLAVLKRRARRA